MAGHRQQVHAEVVHLDGDLADGLGAIAVHQDALAMGDFGDLRDGLDSADLVVGVHDGDEDGFGGDGLLDLPGVNHTVLIDRQVCGATALPFQIAADLGHGRVLDRRRDDVVAPVTMGAGYPLDGVVVGLGAAAGEDQVGLGAAQ